ncbi:MULTISPECIES: NigD1/NigD2 family lipoprotein [Parabacteroides]|uniref:NigD-like protein n=1 Tax=Parabacteroides provencensis TaxID=1944636 RepID=UPI000C15897E|nr:NigD-like protein [Parabacteroides provencensis]
MKTLKSILFVAGVFLTSLTFHSCLDDDGYSLDKFWIEPATVVPINDNSFYLRTDDGSTLWPAAPIYIHYEAKERQRAWVNYTILGDSIGNYSHSIKINGISDILTKDIAKNLGDENDSVYGTDPVSIKNPKQDIWISDNFLNILFRMNYGGSKKHFVNVIQPDEKNPYLLEFRHNAYFDPAVTSTEGLVCFRMESLPDTNGKTVTLTLRVKTFEGEKEYTLEYNSDKQESSDNSKSINMTGDMDNLE